MLLRDSVSITRISDDGVSMDGEEVEVLKNVPCYFSGILDGWSAIAGSESVFLDSLRAKVYFRKHIPIQSGDKLTLHRVGGVKYDIGVTVSAVFHIGRFKGAVI